MLTLKDILIALSLYVLLSAGVVAAWEQSMVAVTYNGETQNGVAHGGTAASGLLSAPF